MKAVVQGYKKGGEGKKSRKQAGSHRFFREHVHTGKFQLNAPELEGLGKLEGTLEQGHVVKYTEPQLKSLIISGGFKKDQFNELFVKPISLIREETKRMETFLNRALASSSKENRICLIGDRGIGKSTLLAQAEAMLVSKGNCIILPIPYALQLVNGSNDYVYDRVVESFIQPMYLKRFLGKILKVNKEQLSELKLSQDIQIESPIKNRQPLRLTKSNSLSDLLTAKAAPRQRGVILKVLIEELQAQESKSVFFLVDNFSAVTSNTRTAYRHPDLKPIHATELQVTSTLLDFASGAKEFKKGGVILATSSDDKPSVTLQAALGLVTPDPYTKSLHLDRAVAKKLQGVVPFTMGKLTKENVGSLVDLLIRSEAFTKAEIESTSRDEIVNNRYVMSGNGNPLELMRSVAMMY